MGKVSLDLAAKPISDSKKDGASGVKKYYARFDAAVELSLPW